MLAHELGVSAKAVEKQIKNLRVSGRLRREGGRARGYWVIIKDNNSF